MKGVFKLIINIVFSVIILIVNKKIIIVSYHYFKENRYILLLIGKIIANFFYELSLWIIIDKFSPNHTPLAIICEEISNFIIDLIFTKKFLDMRNHKYIRIALYLISFFGVILHNEIVVINICGLGSDTKYFLDERLKIETEYNNSDDPDILKRFETLEMTELNEGETITN